MAAEKITALTNLTTPQPTMLLYSGLSPFGVTDDRKVTANNLFAEITANVSDVSIQWGNGVAAAVSAASKGKIIYNATAQAFQVSENGGAYTSLLKGSGTSQQVGFFTAASTIGGDTAFVWDSTNNRLGVNVTVAASTTSLNVRADGSAIAAEFLPNTVSDNPRVQIQVTSSDGRIGTSNATPSPFYIITNNTERISVESGGAVAINRTSPAQAQLHVDAATNVTSAFLANNASGSSVDIGIFQVNGSNRLRITETGEIVSGLASTQDGKLTLASSGASFTQSLQAGTAPAATNSFRWPNADPTAGQVLSASAPAAGVVTLSWVANGSGGGSPGGSNTQLQYNNAGSFGGISGGTSDGTNATFGSGNLRATSPRITTQISDTNGNAIIGLTPTASAVNYVTVTNTATAASPANRVTISTAGSDATIPLYLNPKNAGSYPNGPQIFVPSGTRYDNPEISWAGLPTYGIHQNSGGGWFSINCANLALGAGGATGAAAVIGILANTQLAWGSGTATPIDDPPGQDVGIARDAAGVLRITNASTDQGSLLIAPSSATATAPLDVVAQSSDAAAQTWREFSAGATRVQMLVPASYGQLGTTTNHAFSLMTNNVQRVNIEATGGTVFGTILTATATVMANAIATGDISLVANNLSGTTVDIARFQVNAANRFRFLNTGEAIFGLASTATGKLTLANASGTTLTSISAGNAASTLNFIWPVVDPTAGQVLSASAPSGGNVTLSWVANGSGGGVGGSGTTNTIPLWSASTTLSDSFLSQTSSPNTVTNSGRSTITGLTINTDASNTVSGLTVNSTFTKNDTNSRVFNVARIAPTFNFGGSNLNTTVNLLSVDSTNTATTGAIYNLLNLAFGGTTQFSVDSNGACTFASGVRQAFSPSATVPGLNVGTVSGDPSAPVNGDIWYDSTNNLLRARINSATVSLGAGGGGSPGGSSGDVQYNNAGSFGGTNLTFASNVLTQTRSSLGTTLTESFLLTNSTAAAAGAQQVSPAFVIEGQGWKTNASAASQSVKWGMAVLPVQGAANPTGELGFYSNVNAGGYTRRAYVDTSGTFWATQFAFPSTNNNIAATDGLTITFTTNSVPRVSVSSNDIKILGTGGQVIFNNGGSGLAQAAANVVGFTNASTAGGTFAAVATSPSQITADQNNYNPGGSSYFQRWSTDASRQITGMTFTATQVAGQSHQIWNVGAQDIVLVHESASSTAANRFVNSSAANYTLTPGQGAQLIYDATSSRWRVCLLQ